MQPIFYFQEIAAILISFQRHVEWQSREVKVRPRSGSMLLYSRKKVRYRRDGYCWKKRKDGKTTREDHMKLKVILRESKKKNIEYLKCSRLILKSNKIFVIFSLKFKRIFINELLRRLDHRFRESSASTAVTCIRQSFRRFIAGVTGYCRTRTLFSSIIWTSLTRTVMRNWRPCHPASRCRQTRRSGRETS